MEDLVTQAILAEVERIVGKDDYGFGVDGPEVDRRALLEWLETLPSGIGMAAFGKLMEERN
jgi:hypothetical protein